MHILPHGIIKPTAYFTECKARDRSRELKSALWIFGIISSVFVAITMLAGAVFSPTGAPMIWSLAPILSIGLYLLIVCASAGLVGLVAMALGARQGSIKRLMLWQVKVWALSLFLYAVGFAIAFAVLTLTGGMLGLQSIMTVVSLAMLINLIVSPYHFIVTISIAMGVSKLKALGSALIVAILLPVALLLLSAIFAALFSAAQS